jgi:ABC-type branched-subunit amino acid transport system substrate-binding protein
MYGGRNDLGEFAQKYITIGIPTSLRLINGYEREKAVRLAADAINAKGGIKAGKETGLIVPMAGTKAWTTFGPEIDGVLNSLWEIGHIPAKSYKPSVDFFDKYKTRWGEDVQSDHGVAPAYDSVYVLKRAIEKAGTLDPDKVAKEIENTDMVGAVGKIKFDSGHQLIFGEDPNKTACG